MQPSRALERAGQGQVPLVAHGTRDSAAAQQSRFILCSTGTLERPRWPEEAVKPHQEWSKWEKYFHPQFCQTQTLPSWREGGGISPRGTSNNKDFTSAAHQETILLQVKRKTQQELLLRHFFRGCILQPPLGHGAQKPCSRGHFLPHHTARGLGQTNPKPNPLHNNRVGSRGLPPARHLLL